MSSKNHDERNKKIAAIGLLIGVKTIIFLIASHSASDSMKNGVENHHCRRKRLSKGQI